MPWYFVLFVLCCRREVYCMSNLTGFHVIMQATAQYVSGVRVSEQFTVISIPTKRCSSGDFPHSISLCQSTLWGKQTYLMIKVDQVVFQVMYVLGYLWRELKSFSVEPTK